VRRGFSTRCRALGSSVNKGEEEFCELRHNGVLGSSAIIQNQGVGKGPSRVRTFGPYASTCIFERVSAHSTTTKKLG